MSKVTSKLQVTIPKAIARDYGIEPGSEIEWVAAGEALRVVFPSRSRSTGRDRAERLRLYDMATQRQRARERSMNGSPRSKDRGWSREDLYERGSSD